MHLVTVSAQQLTTALVVVIEMNYHSSSLPVRYRPVTMAKVLVIRTAFISALYPSVGPSVLPPCLPAEWIDASRCIRLTVYHYPRKQGVSNCAISAVDHFEGLKNVNKCLFQLIKTVLSRNRLQLSDGIAVSSFLLHIAKSGTCCI